MLAFRTTKSQNEFVTEALGCNREFVMTSKVRNSVENIDILLKLKIDRQGQVEAISEHLGSRKTPGLPDLRGESIYFFRVRLKLWENWRAAQSEFCFVWVWWIISTVFDAWREGSGSGSYCCIVVCSIFRSPCVIFVLCVWVAIGGWFMFGCSRSCNAIVLVLFFYLCAFALQLASLAGITHIQMRSGL